MSFYKLLKQNLLFSIAGFVCLTSYNAVAFTVDMSLPGITQQIYASPQTGAASHTLVAAYALGGTPPYDMVIPTLSSSSSLRLKILLPPGTSQASIRGESNNWIGTPGNQPVFAVVDGETLTNCPVSSGSGSFTCNGQVMEPPSGGLSAFLYLGNVLVAPKTVSFVLNNPGSADFSFSTLAISMTISDVAAYTNWLATTFNTGGTTTGTGTTTTGGTGTGTGTTTGGATTGAGGSSATQNPCTSAADMVSSISSDLEIRIPRMHFLPGGLPGGLNDFSVRLIPVVDPNNSSEIAFEAVLTELKFMDCRPNS